MSALDRSWDDLRDQLSREIMEDGIRREVEQAHRPDPGPVVRCSRCYTEIQSQFRHDFQSCKCGDVSIDGGGTYTKMSLRDGADYEVLTKEDPPPAA